MTAQLRRIAITATLAVIVAITVPVFVHRRDFDIAVSNWTRDHSAQNATTLVRERAKNHRTQLLDQVAVAFLIFAALNTGLFLKDRLKPLFP
jgi:hypothetical protein